MAKTNILAIIQCKKDRLFWLRLDYSLGQHVYGCTIWEVQVDDGQGGIQERNSREEVQEAICNEVHLKHYNVAEEAPICKGALRGEFGYTAMSPTAQAVLDGTYSFPPNMDEATKDLFLEITQIRQIVPADSVSGCISRAHWQQWWQRVREETSSSISGLHFRH